MKMKCIKAENLFFIQSNLRLFLLLCFVFSYSVSAQVFQNNPQVFISKETTVVEKSSENQKKDSARIYIVKGTKIKGLELTHKALITYIEEEEKSKISLAKNYSKQEEYLGQPTSEKEKPISRKEIILENNNTKNKFSFSLHQTTVIVSTTTQNIKLFAVCSVNEIYRLFYNEAELPNFAFHQSEVTAFLGSAKIRPPPIL